MKKLGAKSLALISATAIAAVTIVSITVSANADEAAPESNPDASASAKAEKPKQSETITLSGELVLTSASNFSEGSICWGEDGYEDITGGALVAVNDTEGNRVALGNLEEGVPDEDNPGVVCHFAFEVTDVPAGSDTYTVEVADRGEVAFDKTEVGYVGLTLSD